MGTGASQSGTDWVGKYYEPQLWETARAQRMMSSLEAAGMWAIEVPEGASSADVPLEGADPTWHFAAENANVGATGEPSPLVDPTQAATAKVSVTPSKAMVYLPVSAELFEDSIIPLLPQLTRQLEESAADQIEYLALNADSETAASTNINKIDGTPASGTSAPTYLMTDSVLKYALVTGGAAGLTTKRDGGTLDSSDFVLTRAMLPDAIASNPSKLVYVSDTATMLKAIQLTDVKDMSVYDKYTLGEGWLYNLWGTPYMASAQMAKADTTGKISVTAANNAFGRIICIYAPYFALVWKRHVKFNTVENYKTDVTEIVGSMRLAFKVRGAGVSAVSYHLTV